MSSRRPGDALFRAWTAGAVPPFDERAGRARFLETLAAGKARPRRRARLAVAVAMVAFGVALAWWREAVEPHLHDHDR